MKIQKIVQRPGPDTILKYIDENTIEINGVDYIFPAEAGPISHYNPHPPVTDAFRDEFNELHVAILIRSDSLQPGVGEWEDFPSEEDDDACIELFHEGAD